jgi:hypothetical protein
MSSLPRKGGTEVGSAKQVLKLFGWDKGYRWYRQEPTAIQALPEV